MSTKLKPLSHSIPPVLCAGFIAMMGIMSVMIGNILMNYSTISSIDTNLALSLYGLGRSLIVMGISTTILTFILVWLLE